MHDVRKNSSPSHESDDTISVSVSLDHGRISDVSVLSTGSRKAEPTWNDVLEPKDCGNE